MAIIRCSDSSYWSTRAEFNHIDGLPEWAKVQPWHSSRPPRSHYLRGYLRGAQARKDWGTLNGKAIIAYAKKALKDALREEQNV